MQTVLIVEDGREYVDFFELFLKGDFDYVHAQSGEQALARLAENEVTLIVLDMRFERSPAEDLLGNVEQIAEQYFGGDLGRAHRYLEENQGTLVLAELRAHDFEQPVLFVSDMPQRKLENLRKLYGSVHAVPNFDAAAIRHEIRKAFEEA